MTVEQRNCGTCAEFLADDKFPRMGKCSYESVQGFLGINYNCGLWKKKSDEPKRICSTCRFFTPIEDDTMGFCMYLMLKLSAGSFSGYWERRKDG